MKDEEIIARLAVLEIFSMSALGIYLANARNDPTFQLAATFLDHLRQQVADQKLPPAIAAKAQRYAATLTANLESNLRQLRGQGGQSH